MVAPARRGLPGGAVLVRRRGDAVRRRRGRPQAQPARRAGVRARGGRARILGRAGRGSPACARRLAPGAAHRALPAGNAALGGTGGRGRRGGRGRAPCASPAGARAAPVPPARPRGRALGGGAPRPRGSEAAAALPRLSSTRASRWRSSSPRPSPSSWSAIRILHGGNVLRRREPWLAIDAKPLVGEPAFDTASFLRDRRPWLLAKPRPERIVARRLDSLSEALGLDRERMRGWALVHALAWGLGEDPNDEVARSAGLFASGKVSRRG